ncbi:MAG: hypothetical protein AAFW66_16310, partial [Pseudomonadota bacterium]
MVELRKPAEAEERTMIMASKIEDEILENKQGENSIVQPNGERTENRNPGLVLTPTLQASAELQYACNFFNDAFWGGKVPDSILTYTRKKNCLGYFAPDRFQNRDGSVVSEIALNAGHLAVRDDKDSLSTLEHELVHAWRHYLGPLNSKGGRGAGGY